MTKESLPRRILWIEDNRASSSVISMVRGIEGFQVDLAENGETAVDMYLAENYVISFMDLNIGALDGLETTRRIREFESLSGRSPCYIVGISASGQPVDRERCLAVGMNTYLPKPFSSQELRNCVNAALD